MSRVTYEDDLGVRGQIRVEHVRPGEPVMLLGDDAQGIEPETPGRILTVDANAAAFLVECVVRRGLSVLEAEVWVPASEVVLRVNGDDPRLSTARPRTLAGRLGFVVAAANGYRHEPDFDFEDPRRVARAVERWMVEAGDGLSWPEVAALEQARRALSAMTRAAWQEVLDLGRPHLSANDARILRALRK